MNVVADTRLVCLGESFESADVVMTPCDTYTSFCCGQNEAARNCCSTGTGAVRIPAGAAMLSLATDKDASVATSVLLSTVAVSFTTTALSCASTNASSTLQPMVGDCNAEKNAKIGVAAGLGAALACALVALLYQWRRINRLTRVPRRK